MSNLCSCEAESLKNSRLAEIRTFAIPARRSNQLSWELVTRPGKDQDEIMN